MKTTRVEIPVFCNNDGGSYFRVNCEPCNGPAFLIFPFSVCRTNFSDPNLLRQFYSDIFPSKDIIEWLSYKSKKLWLCARPLNFFV